MENTKKKGLVCIDFQHTLSNPTREERASKAWSVLLEKIEENGYDVCLITSAPMTDMAHKILEMQNIKIDKQYDNAEKTKAEFYTNLASANHQTVDDLYVIDDSDKNVIAAQKAGAHGIQYTSVAETQNQLQKLGVV